MIENIIAHLRDKLLQGREKHSEGYLLLVNDVLKQVSSLAQKEGDENNIDPKRIESALRFIGGLRFRDGSLFLPANYPFVDTLQRRKLHVLEPGKQVPTEDQSKIVYPNRLLREVGGDLALCYQQLLSLYKMVNYYKPNQQGVITTKDISEWKTTMEHDLSKKMEKEGFKPEADTGSALYKDFTRDIRVNGVSATNTKEFEAKSKEVIAIGMGKKIDELLAPLSLSKQQQASLATAIKVIGGQDMNRFIDTELKTTLLKEGYALGMGSSGDINWVRQGDRIFCELQRKTVSLVDTNTLDTVLIDPKDNKLKRMDPERTQALLKTGKVLPVYDCEARVELRLNSSGKPCLNVVTFVPSYTRQLQHVAESQLSHYLKTEETKTTTSTVHKS